MRLPTVITCSALTLLTAPAFAQSTAAPPIKGADPVAPTKNEKTPVDDALTPVAHVETVGTGPVHMILIPGLSCDWTVWRAFMDRNARDYTMHAVTLPGFGGSNPPPRPAGTPVSKDVWLSNDEKAIVALADQLKLDKPVVMGHSLGSFLAIHLAVDHPGRFAGCIGIDGFPAFPINGPAPISIEDRRKKVETEMPPQFDAMMGSPEGTAQMFRSMVTNPARADEIAKMASVVPSATVKGYFLELLAGDEIAALKKNQTPLLLIGAIMPKAAGEPPYADQMRQGVRDMWKSETQDAANTKLAFIEDTRHFVMDDQPAKLDEAVKDFVATLKK